MKYSCILFLNHFLTERSIKLDYCIKNNRNVYLKLDKNGAPVTCAENFKGIFEYSKARNILSNLPKILKQFNFKVEAIPDIPLKVENKIITTNYQPSENVLRWIEKFGQCEDVINEANERNEELNGELSDVDLKLQDILHEIELSEKCDMYKAWQLINDIRDLRKQRRNIKDEKLILSGIKSQGITYLNRNAIQKCVDGLSSRRYKIRIIEEDEDNAVL